MVRYKPIVREELGRDARWHQLRGDQDGAVRTATFGTIARFMEGYGLADEVYRLTPAGREEVRY